MKTHYNNLSKAKQNFNKVLPYISNNIIPILYYGDPNIITDYVYDNDNKILIVKSKDDYFNLPNKNYNFISAVMKIYPDIDGIFELDDDVNYKPDILLNFISINKSIDYYGIVIHINEGDTSTYFQRYKNIIDTYPKMKDVGFYLKESYYCPSGAMYISKKAINIILNNPDYFKPFPDDYEKYIFNGVCYNVNAIDDYNIGLVLYENNIIPVNWSNIRDYVTW